MNECSTRTLVPAVAAAFAALTAVVLFVHTAAAQSPAGAQPTPGLPCPGMMNVQSGTIDPSLSVTLSATLDAEAREVTLTWTMGGPSKCAWIQHKSQGYDYFAMADFIHPPGAGSRIVRPLGLPGEFCWRVFAVSDIGHSEPAEACLRVDNPNGPPPIVDGPFPPATPAPGPAGPNCPTYLNLATVPLDPTLQLSLHGRWDGANRGIELTWTMPEHARCAWFQVKLPGRTYSGFEQIPWADFVLAPGDSRRVMPTSGLSGSYCYRLWTFSRDGRSQPAEACVEVDASAIPTPLAPGATFPTPELPLAPIKVLLEGRLEVTDMAGKPLPYEQQTWFAGISWEAIPGFTGTYQVERARTDVGFAHGFGAAPTGRVPATNVQFGRLESIEQVTPGTSWCFRVRAVLDGRYLGPPSEEVCTPALPSSQVPPTQSAPLPPDAGNTPSPTAPSALLFSFASLAAFMGALLLAAANRRRN